ncbi:LysR family transcriptional regulator [Agrobacterium vitis]|uniref:LysR family transcriptional regulator n=1 Tax=Allorhizobium ampelinum TaxID=3025782 RepID=UPI001F2C5C93|nr:LysR family transcriptional regulator [Allorhizobium ampelinum]MCF1448890.1 LysR family transcriptional regulator [Allorhizobium ampelinum]
MNADQLSWDLYRSLLAVITEGSLSGAARQLGLTQPTVGRHIEMLEQAFGTPLFVRSQRGLLPTETALAMRGHAALMAATSTSLARIAAGEQGEAGELRGPVRISASEMIAVEVLPPMFTRLQEQFPGLEIELSATDQMEDLLHREVDIAVRMVAPTQLALISRHIGAIGIGFYAHRRYLERHGTPSSLAQLAEHRLIGFDRQLAYIRDLLRTRPDLDALHFQFRSDSNLAQFAAIRAGLGIGMCQPGLARRHADLIEVLPGALNIALDTFVVMHEDLKLSRRCRTVFDAVVEGLLAYLRE